MGRVRSPLLRFLSGAAFAGAFNGDEADDGEEQDDDGDYDAECNHPHRVLVRVVIINTGFFMGFERLTADLFLES